MNKHKDFYDEMFEDFINKEIEKAKQEERNRIIEIIHKLVPQGVCYDCNDSITVCIKELEKHIVGDDEEREQERR